MTFAIGSLNSEQGTKNTVCSTLLLHSTKTKELLP